MRFWAECGSFLRECRHHFNDTGAVLPSSRFLGRALAAELRRPRRPGRILEVGPGTGSVTKEILRFMMPGDSLDAVELNETFVSVLEARCQREEAFRQHRDQIRLIHAPVQELEGKGIYDYIVSGLPLNNFPASEVRDIFRAYTRLLKPGGTLTYFEYVLIRHLKTPFATRQERRRLYRVGRVVSHFISAYQVKRERVFRNVPPAVVRHFRFQPDSAELPRIDTPRSTSRIRALPPLL